MQKLQESEIYNFKIIKITGTPYEKYYVLEDRFGIRHLIEAIHYPTEKYNFEIGKEISCRVDKINCKGQIFLEPQHPKYEIGEKIEFTLKEDEYSEQTDIFTAEDAEKMRWEAIFEKNENQKFPLKAIFKIENIKKGKLYLIC